VRVMVLREENVRITTIWPRDLPYRVSGLDGPYYNVSDEDEDGGCG
jgi:hypothetical protein